MEATTTYLLFAFGAFGAFGGFERRVFVLEIDVVLAANRATRRFRIGTTLLGFLVTLSFAGRHHSLPKDGKLIIVRERWGDFFWPMIAWPSKICSDPT